MPPQSTSIPRSRRRKDGRQGATGLSCLSTTHAATAVAPWACAKRAPRRARYVYAIRNNSLGVEGATCAEHGVGKKTDGAIEAEDPEKKTINLRVFSLLCMPRSSLGIRFDFLVLGSPLLFFSSCHPRAPFFEKNGAHALSLWDTTLAAKGGQRQEGATDDTRVHKEPQKKNG